MPWIIRLVSREFMVKLLDRFVPLMMATHCWSVILMSWATWAPVVLGADWNVHLGHWLSVVTLVLKAYLINWVDWSCSAHLVGGWHWHFTQLRFDLTCSIPTIKSWRIINKSSRLPDSILFDREGNILRPSSPIKSVVGIIAPNLILTNVFVIFWAQRNAVLDLVKKRNHLLLLILLLLVYFLSFFVFTHLKV